MTKKRRRAPWVIVAASAMSLTVSACDDDSHGYCDPCDPNCDLGTCNPPFPIPDGGYDGGDSGLESDGDGG